MTFIYDKLAFENKHIRFEYKIIDFLNLSATILKSNFNTSYLALNSSFFYGFR